MNDDLETLLSKLDELLQHRYLDQEEYTKAKEKLFVSDNNVNHCLIPHLVRLAETYHRQGLSEVDYIEAKTQLKRRFNF
jgi:uncharacterized protein YqgQ